MQYLDRTALVKAALLGKPSILDTTRDIFRRHFAGDKKDLPWKGEGTLRVVYAVGTCNVPEGEVPLLLKVRHEANLLSHFDEVAGCMDGYETIMTGEREELGAFDMYYSVAAGLRHEIGYQSDEARVQFLEEAKEWATPRELGLFRQVSTTFRIDSDEWNGTRVAEGDVGALPYANVVVKCNGLYGLLVEGRPSLVKPLGSARRGVDEATVEHHRIIDLGSAHCLLSMLNGKMNRKTFLHGDYLGLIATGAKYFAPEYRLDL